MFYRSLKAYTYQELSSMSASELKTIALDLVDYLSAQLERICHSWSLFQQKLEEIDIRKLTAESRLKFEALQVERESLERSIQKMNALWLERVRLLGRTDQVGFFRVWGNDIKEIIYSREGLYAVNGLAMEYLKKVLRDNRAIGDLTRKTNKLNELLERLNSLETITNQKIEVLGISLDEAARRYEGNSRKERASSFDSKF